MAKDPNSPGIMLQGNFPSIRIIAQLENINLKDGGNNFLTWVGTNLSSNTSFERVSIKCISGTYNPTAFNSAATTITFENNWPLAPQSVPIKIDGNTVHTILNASYSDTNEFMEAVKAVMETFGWTVTILGLDMTILSNAADNGAVIDLEKTLSGPGSWLSASPAFGEGVGESFIDFVFDGDPVDFGETFMELLTNLSEGKEISLSLIRKNWIKSYDADFLAPVTVGLADDYIISIFVFGDKRID